MSLPKSQFYGQFRVGRVSSVDEDRHTAQVEFFEIDGFISFDLQVLVTRPGDYSLPDPGSVVLCVLIDGRLGVGFVVGALYTENDEPPLADGALRSIAGDDIRIGDPEATDKAARAPVCKSNFDDLKQHFDSLWAILTGPPIAEAGNGGPSALQAALGAAIQASPYPTPEDPAAENVSIK